MPSQDLSALVIGHLQLRGGLRAKPASSFLRFADGRSARFLRGLPRALPLQKSRHGLRCDSNCMAHVHVREVAALAEAVNDRRAHSEKLGDLADAEQGAGGFLQQECSKTPTNPYQIMRIRRMVSGCVSLVIAKGVTGDQVLPAPRGGLTRQGSQVRILQRPPRNLLRVRLQNFTSSYFAAGTL